MERWDAPLKVIATVWWPICAYSGWIAVATIANISAYLAKTEWEVLFSAQQWTVIMISVAGLLNLFMIYNRNMREFALVGIWAITAIAVRHWSELPLIKWTSVFWAAMLFIAVALHGYRNRETNPFKKAFGKGGE